MGADVDRHDNVRVCVRRHGRKQRIRDWSSAAAFMAEYRTLYSGSRDPAPWKSQPAAGSLRWLCERYYGAAEFLTLEDRIRQVRRRLLNRLCEAHGSKPVGQLEKRHVRDMRDAKVKAGTPEAANNLLKVLRALFTWALDAELVDHNPARDVAKIKTTSAGHHTWTVEEVRRFEARPPIGSKARLALAVMLYTGVRASDAIRLGRQMERSRRLHFTEYKDRNRRPKQRAIPILPELRAVIDATPSGHMSYLVTAHGKPYSTAKSYGNWFKRRCVMAGLGHCSAHGLRKVGATVAAERGASSHALMAIFGWTTLKEAERYTRAADQQRLADEHMALIVPLSEPVEAGGTIKKKSLMKQRPNVKVEARAGLEPA